MFALSVLQEMFFLDDGMIDWSIIYEISRKRDEKKTFKIFS